MQRCYGDIMEGFETPDKSKLLVFTANGILTKSSKLVMGAGIAKAVRDRYVGIDEWFGRSLRQRPELLIPTHTDCNDFVYAYEFHLLRGLYRHQPIAALQTKLHFSTPSPLELVHQSLERLAAITDLYSEIHLTMPGVANGKLPLASVLPLVEQLPNNCYVWSKRGQF